MLINWLDELLNYDFTIIHKPGVLNVLPDHLSQLYPEVNQQYIRCIRAARIDTPDVPDEVIPKESEQKVLIEQQHLLGHFGTDAIVQGLKDQGYQWKNMRQQALQCVSACVKCQRYNIQKHGFHPTKTITAELPGDHYAIDLADPYQRPSEAITGCL